MGIHTHLHKALKRGTRYLGRKEPKLKHSQITDLVFKVLSVNVKRIPNPKTPK